MAKNNTTANTKVEAPAPQSPLSLEDLKKAAEAARLEATAAREAANKDDATDEVKAAALAAEEAAGKAEAELQAAEEAAAENQRKLDEQAAAAAAAEAQAKATAEDDDQRYVPVFLDEDGERIPRNRVLRLVTTTNQNLRSLDGALITPEPTCELNGFDVRKGDWYTVQYQAGLIVVDSTKKAK